MSEIVLEHVNLTVSDPRASAARLVELFGWHIRWEGAARGSGYTVHVGGASSYLALYGENPEAVAAPNSYVTAGGLNHVGVEVADLDAVRERVTAAGFEPYGFGEYEPGRRFYFRDPDGVEFEVVSYR
ncbi:MAG: VOC family protein [Pseudomonadota bacterium]